VTPSSVTADPNDMSEPAAVTIHSSWRGLVFGAIGAAIIAGLGVLAVVRSDGAGGPLVLLGVGMLLIGVVVFDLPVSSTFDADGVTRRALLRRHRLAWTAVDQLTRARPSMIRVRRLKPGGLVARVGRRRYLLVDQCESVAEYEEVERVLGAAAELLRFDDLLIPPADAEPTWLYRRKRWAENSASDS